MDFNKFVKQAEEIARTDYRSRFHKEPKYYLWELPYNDDTYGLMMLCDDAACYHIIYSSYTRIWTVEVYERKETKAWMVKCDAFDRMRTLKPLR